MTHPAREVARLVARAGWPVIPMVTSSDDKIPCVPWKNDPTWVCRSEADVVEKWPARWPRWATICGVRRELDARALVCLDADSPSAAGVARSLLPHHTRIGTGRKGGEHTWASIPWRGDELLCRFYVSRDLDWRGGDCIVLLPGSLWAPVSHPEVVYTHLSGPELPEVLQFPAALAKVILKRALNAGAAPSQQRRGGARGAGSGGGGTGEADLSADGAFEKFLAAVARSGRTVNRTRRAGEAFVQCPGAGHPDRNRNRPCLHVTARGGGIGLHCFGNRGCTTAGIVAALGLELADLYDPLNLEIVLIDSREEEKR